MPWISAGRCQPDLGLQRPDIPVTRERFDRRTAMKSMLTLILKLQKEESRISLRLPLPIPL